MGNWCVYLFTSLQVIVYLLREAYAYTVYLLTYVPIKLNEYLLEICK